MSPGAQGIDAQGILNMFIAALELPNDCPAEYVSKLLSDVTNRKVWAELDRRMKCHSRVMFRTFQAKCCPQRLTAEALAQLEEDYLGAIAVDGRAFSFSAFLGKIAQKYPQYPRHRIAAAVRRLHIRALHQELLSTAASSTRQPTKLLPQ